jgi:hypothetical protein
LLNVCVFIYLNYAYSDTLSESIDVPSKTARTLLSSLLGELCTRIRKRLFKLSIEGPGRVDL